jgi:hypothetical protein
MFHNIILVLATAGQCGPSGCFLPGREIAYPSSFASVQFRPVEQAVERPTLTRLAATLKGRRIEVDGWLTSSGKVAFNERDQRPGWTRPLDDAKERPPMAILEPEPGPKSPDPPKAAKPPEPTPAAPTPIREASFTTNGVDRSKMDATEKWTAEGVAGRIFMESLRGGTAIADAEADAIKPHLTVVGTKEDRQAVRDALASSPELAALRPLVHFRDFDPKSPYVMDIGLASGRGKPEIILQRPGGAVVWRQFDFNGGGKQLAAEIVRSGAVRKPNPDYKIDRDPNPSSRDPRPSVSWIAILGIVGIIAVFIVPSGRKRQ